MAQEAVRLRPAGCGTPQALGSPVVGAETPEPPPRGPCRGTPAVLAAAAVAEGRSVQRLARQPWVLT